MPFRTHIAPGGNKIVPSSAEPMTLKFRCPAELEGKIPAPIPAALGMPDWLKTAPQQAFNAINQRADDTVKRCPPFIDAMTSGFLIPLICDLRIENGEITYPVHEITVAGNLKDMFRNLTAASDLEFRYGTNAPTVRIEGMTIAGA